LEAAEDAKGRRGLLAGDGDDSVIPAQAGIQFFLETPEAPEGTERISAADEPSPAFGRKQLHLSLGGLTAGEGKFVRASLSPLAPCRR
jgi:hypothetical protein